MSVLANGSKILNSKAAGTPGPNTDTLVSVASILPDNPAEAESFIQESLSILAAHYHYYELLLIDNGSPVGVYLEVQGLQAILPNLRVVRLSRRYSMEVALAAALDHCIGDFVVIMDPVAHPPELIPQLVTLGLEGSDSIVAVPTVESDGFLDRFIGVPLFRVASRILGFQLRREESYYRLFSRRLVNSIVRIRSKNRYLSCLNASIGLHQTTVSYEGIPVRQKHSAPGRILRQLVSISDILVSNSAVPLRFASMLGLIACIGNLFYLVYILVVSLIKTRLAEGWLTTSLTQTTMFLLLFLILTVVSEYIARILDETKDQPLYFVESETHSSVSATNQERLNIVQHNAQTAKGASAG